MNIIVLVKQVPATESMIAADGAGVKLDNVKWVMNPYDELAVEEALRLKQDKGGAVTLVSAGPERAVECLRVGLAMGADNAMLVSDPALESLDGIGVAKVLAAAVKTLSPDLVIAGQRAVDDDAYLVGPAVAEFLGIAHVSMVVKQSIAEGRITCQRTVEGGTLTFETALPALITTQRGLNEPRYASLPGIMKAKKKPIDRKTLADLGLSADAVAPKAKVVAMSPPKRRQGGRIIEGESAQAKAAALVKALREEAKVI